MCREVFAVKFALNRCKYLFTAYSFSSSIWYNGLTFFSTGIDKDMNRITLIIFIILLVSCGELRPEYLFPKFSELRFLLVVNFCKAILILHQETKI